jgi:hypothetical protein
MDIDCPVAFRFLVEPARYKVAYGGRPDGRSATQVNVQYGQSAGTIFEVRDGIKPGDKVII